MARSFLKIIMSRIIGFVIFLILIGVASLLTGVIHNSIYFSFVEFFISNLGLLIFLMIIGLVSEIVWNLYFPINIIAPIISAIVGFYSIIFIYRFWILFDSYVNSGIVIPLSLVFRVVIPLIIILGYITLLARHGMPRDKWIEERREWRKEKMEMKIESKKDKIQRKIEEKKLKIEKRNIEWKEVGEEFKRALYSIGKSLNSLFEKDNKKKKK